MSDGDGAQPWGERSEFTLLRWCFSRRCDTGSLQEEEGQRCRWGVRSHLHLQLLSTPLSSCFFIRLGFQAKVRQTGGRNVMQCPEATGRRARKNLWNWWEIFFFISLFLYKTRNLNQVCNTDSTVWYMTELTSLYNNHPTVTTAQLRAIFQSNQFCFFFFFPAQYHTQLFSYHIGSARLFNCAITLTHCGMRIIVNHHLIQGCSIQSTV